MLAHNTKISVIKFSFHWLNPDNKIPFNFSMSSHYVNMLVTIYYVLNLCSKSSFNDEGSQLGLVSVYANDHIKYVPLHNNLWWCS